MIINPYSVFVLYSVCSHLKDHTKISAVKRLFINHGCQNPELFSGFIIYLSKETVVSV